MSPAHQTTKDISIILDATRRIETMLVDKFNATGRGLHEKLSSVERRIPRHVRGSIRYIATLRNKAVHEDGFEITDPAEFLAKAEWVYSELVKAPVPEPGEFLWKYLAIGSAAVAVIAIILLVVNGRPSANRPVANTVVTDADLWSVFPGQSHMGVSGTSDDQPRDVAHASEPPPSASMEGTPSMDVARAVLKGKSGALSNDALGVEEVIFGYAKGSFNRMEPTLQIRVRNNSGRTLSSARLHARLYVDGDPAPLVATDDGHFFSDPLFVSFGETGLAPGATVLKKIYFSLDARRWTLPDALNANTRAVMLRVVETTDGSGRPIGGEAPPFATVLRDVTAAGI